MCSYGMGRDRIQRCGGYNGVVARDGGLGRGDGGV